MNMKKMAFLAISFLLGVQHASAFVVYNENSATPEILALGFKNKADFDTFTKVAGWTEKIVNAAKSVGDFAGKIVTDPEYKVAITFASENAPVLNDIVGQLLKWSPLVPWYKKIAFGHKEAWNYASVRSQLGQNVRDMYFAIFDTSNNKLLFAGPGNIEHGLSYTNNTLEDHGK